MISFSLLENVTLLISVAVVFDLTRLWELPRRAARHGAMGALFGVAAVVSMVDTVPLISGFVHDSRALAVALSGLLGGPLTAAVSMIFAGVYRFLIGGAGTIFGFVEILYAALLGVAGYTLTRRYRFWRGWAGLVITGLLLNGGILLGYFFFLPYPEAMEVARLIALDQLILYPLAFALLGRFFYDRAERRRVEVEGREHQALYRSLFEESRAVILLIRPEDGAIVDANPYAEEFYGWSRDELKGMRIAELDTLDEEELKEWLRGAATGSGVSYREYRHRQADGSLRDVAVQAVPVLMEEKTLLHSIVFDISRRKEKDQRLEESLRERDALLQEIHHRVKNNLTVISSLINIQVRGAESWEQAFGALQKTRDRINTMGEVHNVLYHSGDLSRLDVSQFVLRRVESLTAAYGRPGVVEAQATVERVFMHIETAIPFSLILNELLTNALKHAFPRDWSGTVRVTLRALDSGGVHLGVADDGVGLPWGEESEPSDALGIQLAKLLAEQLNAVLTVSVDNGTRVDLTVPASRSLLADRAL
ncbi:MAG: sensor histidine kinase [Spirochaetaceae bacterium]